MGSDPAGVPRYDRRVDDRSVVPTNPPTESPDADQSLSLRPPRRAFVLSYLGVVVAGLLGAAIGAGLVDAMCRGDCTANVAAGAVTGAIVAAVGVAVVAVLMLRAMHEWNQYQARIDMESIPSEPPDTGADRGYAE